MVSIKMFLFSLTTVYAFFNPTVTLSNGKSVTLNGKGPPVLFSTGLFGTMPQQFYNNLISQLKKEVTVITFNGIMPITPDDVSLLTDELKVDSIMYASHSSFNPDILELKNINTAVLVDPIVIPNLDINGFISGGFNSLDGRTVEVDYPVSIIKAEKLYQSSLELPTWQELEIKGDVQSEVYDGVGHPDILDDTWANIAVSTKLWGVAKGDKVPFNEWKYDSKNTVPEIRKEYRNYICKRILEYVNNKTSNGDDNKLIKKMSTPIDDITINELPIN